MRTRISRDIQQQIERLPEVQQDTEDAAEMLAAEARRRAPKKTGKGAASIHAEKRGRGQAVSWDEAHDYMRFPEFGTEDMPPQAFLRGAVKALDRH